MGKATFDDGTSSNPKLITAGAPAAWLWFCGVLYCRRALTDGFIPKVVVPSLAIGLPSPYRHAARLVAAGLWHATVIGGIDGYVVHDYLDWNPTKAQIEAWRSNDKERKRRRKSDREGYPDSESESETESTSDSAADSRQTPRAYDARREVGVSVGVRVEGSPKGEESARETPARVTVEPAVGPRWRPRDTRVASLTSHEIYHRRNCAPWAWAACQAGACIPKYLWPQWEQRRPVTELQPFVETWAARVAGDRAEDFWPRAFAHAFGEALPKAASSRSGDTVDSAREFLSERLQHLQPGGE